MNESYPQRSWLDLETTSAPIERVDRRRKRRRLRAESVALANFTRAPEYEWDRSSVKPGRIQGWVIRRVTEEDADRGYASH